MIRVVIIDDENLAINNLKSLFHEFFEFIEVVGTARSVEEGKKIIIKHSPDVVFLDIKMNDGSGFDLLEHFSTSDFKVVFVTAYSEYALKAIKKRAFDYLLKPVDLDDLESMLIDIKREFQGTQLNTSFPTKLSIPYKNGNIYLELDKILRIEALGSYSKLFSNDGKSYTISCNLKHIEAKLDPAKFFRCHHSHVINLSKVKRVRNEVGMVVVLDDESQVAISKRRKIEFNERMETSMYS